MHLFPDSFSHVGFFSLFDFFCFKFWPLFLFHKENAHTQCFIGFAKLKFNTCFFQNLLQVNSHGFRGKTPSFRFYALFQAALLAFVTGAGPEQVGIDEAFSESFLFQLEHFTKGLFLEFSPGFEDILYTCSIVFFRKDECIAVFRKDLPELFYGKDVGRAAKSFSVVPAAVGALQGCTVLNHNIP